MWQRIIAVIKALFGSRDQVPVVKDVIEDHQKIGAATTSYELDRLMPGEVDESKKSSLSLEEEIRLSKERQQKK